MNIPDKIKDKSNIAAAVMLALIIAVQLVYTVGVFNSKKTFHTDEMWSYGLANSNGRPFLFMQPGIRLADKVGQEAYKFGEWTDGSYYRDYLVVDESNRFNYKNVVENQKLDMHPPLYFSILHTICSFFPEQFSWYFGFSINIVSLCATQIFLYLLAYELTRRRGLSLLTCVVFGASMSAVLLFTFVRQYALLTAWCTAYVYFTVKLVKSDFNFKKYLAPVIVCLFLGGLTQQLVLMFAGGLTFCICVYLLIKRKIKKMLIFGFSMAATVVLYIGIWPYALGTAAEYEVDHLYAYWAEVRLFLDMILCNTFGLTSPISPLASRKPLFLLILLIAAMAAPVCFLLRNEAGYKRFLRIIRVRAKRIIKSADMGFVLSLCIIGAFAAAVLVSAKMGSVGVMGSYSIRYVIYTLPAFIAAAVYLFWLLCRFVFKNKRVCAVIVCVAAAVSCVQANRLGTDFICDEDGILSHTQLREMLAGKKVIFSVIKIVNIQCMPEFFMDSDSVYTARCNKVLSDTDYFENVRNEDTFYFIINDYKTIRESEIESFALSNPYIPNNADKQTMLDMGIQFYEDYEKLFADTGFIKEARIVGETETNGFKNLIYEIHTK